MKRVTMYIPQAVFDIVGKVAKTKQLPYSQIIRGAIWEHLNKKSLFGADILNDIQIQAQCHVKK